MERDFVQKYVQHRPQLTTLFREIYSEVVGDLIAEVQQAEGHRFEEDNRFLRRIAVEAVGYAREFTRDRTSPLFEARRSKARTRLQDALVSWRHDYERQAAEWKAPPQITPKRPRRKGRNAAKRKKH